MKKNFLTRIRNATVIVTTSMLLFASCNGIVGMNETTTSESNSSNTEESLEVAKIVFNVAENSSSSALASTASRTVFPEVDLTSYKYTLVGALDGGTEETFIEDKTYTEFLSSSISVATGSWALTLTATSNSTEILSGTTVVELYEGSQTVGFVLGATDGSTGNVSVTLNYPLDSGVEKVTAALYDTANASDIGTEQTITNGSEYNSVTFTASDVDTNTTKFVRFFLYDSNSFAVGKYTESVYVVSNLTSSASRTISSLNTYEQNITVTKDGSAFTGLNVTLVNGSLVYQLDDSDNDGVYTSFVSNGTFDLYINDCTVGIECESSPSADGKSNLAFYTLTLNNESAETEGTASIYELYGRGFFLTDFTQIDESSVGITIPEKSEVTFSGYYSEADGKGTRVIDENGYLVADFSTKYVTEAKTLYACFVDLTQSYTITYELNGGTNNENNVSSYSPSDSVYLFYPKYSGKTFAGWYTSSDFSDDILIELPVFSHKNITLYAKWNTCAAGDIVCLDESFVTSDVFEAREYAPSAAVIFYSGDGEKLGRESGTTLTLGVSVIQSYGCFAPKETTAYSTKITAVECTATYSSGYTFTGDLDGSDNWEKICAVDTDALTNISSYSAFYKAENYATLVDTGVTGTNFEDGWYIPTIAEMYECAKCEEAESTFELLNADWIDDTEYYTTSSQSIGGDDKMYEYYEGIIESWEKHYDDYIIFIRDFSVTE